jgi:hypothetical protein
MPSRYISSLTIVEDFYGEQLTPALLSKIRQTPVDQLIELANRLNSYGDTLAEVLEIRGDFRPETRQAYARDRGISESYDLYLNNDVYAHDGVSMLGSTEHELIESGELKHLLVYTERLIVPDFVPGWSFALELEKSAGYPLDEARRGHDLAKYLHQIMPLADLVRSGDVLLVPGGHDFRIGDTLVDMASASSSDLFYTLDPYIAWNVVHKLGLVKPWEIAARGLQEEVSEGHLYEAVEYCLSTLSSYGDPHSMQLEQFGRKVIAKLWPGLSDEEVRQMVAFSFVTREAATIPISSNPTVLQHIERSGAILLENELPRGLTGPRSFAPAIQYHIPRLAHLSIEDIIRLRRDEEIFDDLRQSLIGLTDQAMEMPHSDGYSAYSDTVGQLAEDIIRPTYERMERARKRASVRSVIWGYGSGGVVSLGLNAIGMLIGIPGPLRSAAGFTVGGATRAKALKQGSRKRRSLEVAGSILYSLLD